MSAQRAKGSTWERRITEWLRPRFPWVERRALAGAQDRGDIAGLAGVVIEAKAVAPEGLVATMSAGLRELMAEVDNDHAALGLLCIKRPGTTDPGEAYWIIDPRHVQNLIAMVDIQTRGGIVMREVQ